MTTSNNNYQLIMRCRRGDAHAWQQLIQRYGRLVHSIPVRYGLSPAEVEDVGQEVFLALAQSLAQIEDPESLPAWFMTTARRYSWRAIQRRKREQPLAGHDLTDTEFAEAHAAVAVKSISQHFGSQTPSMVELLRGWQHQELLTQGLSNLNERCRALLTAVFLDQAEPSYDEISEQLGIPKGSIGPTRNRCLQQLRVILEGLGFSQDEL
ncbi:MAG: sigma-70 family RNA polymerase sigma factor [Caldilineaceae bacterium]